MSDVGIALAIALAIASAAAFAFYVAFEVRRYRAWREADRHTEAVVAAARALHADEYEPWDPPDPAEVRRYGPVWSDQ